eukprot:13624341-Alexandrium_andersonii.AAC.1
MAMTPAQLDPSNLSDRSSSAAGTERSIPRTRQVASPCVVSLLSFRVMNNNVLPSLRVRGPGFVVAVCRIQACAT